ncbi:MAG TPA: hypothetical protein VI543_00690 [Sulfuricaulis sp.]|nr:hypothetical protein [Sulfuricaulis sp.]
MRTALLLLMHVLAVPASALGIKDWERAKDSEVFLVHINGIGEGYSFANAWLAGDHRPMIYCEPKSGLKAEDYLLILKREMNNKKSISTMPPDTPLEGILLQGLINNFPCKQ